jgi:ribosomal protein RSM22 (predicted rRNA methylase)
MARASAVAIAGHRFDFFSGLASVVDYGSGLGSALFALLGVGRFPMGISAIDASPEALELADRLASDDFAGHSLRRTIAVSAVPPAPAAGELRLACFSYSLTELGELPPWALACEALFIVEPSTRDDGRKLQRLRAKALAAGFYAWAPCPHQGPCALLERSERDWCHGRASFEPPAWWPRLEARLPMKNRTVSFSYFLARKTPPSPRLNGTTRAVGDPLREKGKTRIAICRGAEREFLAWFPGRMAEAPDLERGDLFRVPDTLEIRGQQETSREARLASSNQLSMALAEARHRATEP